MQKPHSDLLSKDVREGPSKWKSASLGVAEWIAFQNYQMPRDTLIKKTNSLGRMKCKKSDCASACL